MDQDQHLEDLALVAVVLVLVVMLLEPALLVVLRQQRPELVGQRQVGLGLDLAGPSALAVMALVAAEGSLVDLALLRRQRRALGHQGRTLSAIGESSLVRHQLFQVFVSAGLSQSDNFRDH